MPALIVRGGLPYCAPAMSRLPLGEAPIGLAEVSRLLSDRPPELALDPAAAARVKASRATVERAAKAGDVTYGVNTGFGKLASTRISEADLATLQLNLIRSHSVGVGAPLRYSARLSNVSTGHSPVVSWPGYRFASSGGRFRSIA